jgi:hypothetical protein
MVFDSSVPLPGNDWTDAHFAQGFSRRDSSVNFWTLIQFGYGQVIVFDGAYVNDLTDERVITVPFHCPSGKVLVEGPEENTTNDLVVESGWNLLTSAQSFDHKRQQLRICLFFEKIDYAADRSLIVLKDDQLNPSYPLVETSEIAI